MKQSEYLLSPGAEVTAESAVEALALFRKSGILIDELPLLGTIRSKANPEQEYCVWAFVKESFHVISLFVDVDIPSYSDWEFMELQKDEILMSICRRTYKVMYSKNLGIYVRKIVFYWQVAYAQAEAALLGYPDAEFMLCRLYVTAENNRFLTVCWIGFDEVQNATIFVKVFEDDFEDLLAYPSMELGRVAIEFEESFWRHGKRYTLCKDNNDQACIKPAAVNLHMRILK